MFYMRNAEMKKRKELENSAQRSTPNAVMQEGGDSIKGRKRNNTLHTEM
jgi:hypothetical protein